MNPFLICDAVFVRDGRHVDPEHEDDATERLQAVYDRGSKEVLCALIDGVESPEARAAALSRFEAYTAGPTRSELGTVGKDSLKLPQGRPAILPAGGLPDWVPESVHARLFDELETLINRDLPGGAGPFADRLWMSFHQNVGLPAVLLSGSANEKLTKVVDTLGFGSVKVAFTTTLLAMQAATEDEDGTITLAVG